LPVFGLNIEIYGMKKPLRIVKVTLATLALLIVVIAMACFKPADTTPYNEEDFYKLQMDAADSAAIQLLNISATDTVFKAGWSRINLLPPFTTPIAIDAHRGGKHYTGVHDSIYVRAFVFKMGNRKVAYISADLLITPPTVRNIFNTLLHKQGFDNRNIYYTATHTHTSIGAWYNSYVGKIFAGEYDERVPQHIANCIAQAITQAEANCTEAKIGFGQYPTKKLVFNRLVHDSGTVDPMIRVFKIQKVDGQTAAIITFAAHATVFHENLMQLSADWPGLMMTELQNDSTMNFACFSAGAVGSQGPFETTKNQETEAKYMAIGVAAIIKQNFDSIEMHTLSVKKFGGMQQIPLYLRQPNLRILPHIVVRPWLFNALFGDEKPYINVLSIDNVVLTGMPCDFSGELVAGVDSVAKRGNKHLIITGFNGGYIGYITNDKWYNLDTYETRTMGWFGPGSGNYISKITMRLLQ